MKKKEGTPTIMIPAYVSLEAANKSAAMILAKEAQKEVPAVKLPVSEKLVQLLNGDDKRSSRKGASSGGSSNVEGYTVKADRAGCGFFSYEFPRGITYENLKFDQTMVKCSITVAVTKASLNPVKLG
tara:strand:- start:34 stop:414 length:381 start_codon:yes stop_codon:yes gene_type:complete